MERSSKRRRVEPQTAFAHSPVSAFVAAKAKFTEKSLEHDTGGTLADDLEDDGVIGPHVASDVERLSDYGDENGSNEEHGVLDEQRWSTETQLSNWMPTTQSIVQETVGSLVLRLAYVETLCIVGHYTLALQHGTIEIAGVRVNAGMGRLPVFAASTDALPVVRCVSRGGAVVTLHSQPGWRSSAKALERFSPLFQRIWAPDSSDDEPNTRSRTFAILQKTTDDPYRRRLRPLDLPAGWDDAWSLIRARPERPKIIAVIGLHAYGKGHLSRALINNALTVPLDRRGPVYLVDLDSERPELTLPGQVSASHCEAPFIGPSFGMLANQSDVPFSTALRSHASEPLLQQGDERHLLACARDLLSTCLQHASKLSSDSIQAPTIVVKFSDISQGLGSTLTVELLKSLQPGKVFSVARGPPKVLSDITAACPAGVLHELEPLPSETAGSTRALDELHDMQLLASAHSNPRSTLVPLAQQRPLCVSYAAVRKDFLAVACYPDLPADNFLSDLLSASIVSIVLLEVPSRFDVDIKRETSSGLPFLAAANGMPVVPFDPANSRLVGVALVRAVDTQRQVLELLPIDGADAYDKLSPRELILVHGCFGTSRAILGEEMYWWDHDITHEAEPDLIDDSVDALKQPTHTPYVDIVTGEQDVSEARWKARRFNMGGAS